MDLQNIIPKDGPAVEEVQKYIKKYIDEILNTKSSFTAKIPVRKDKLREYFCNILI